MPPRSHPYRSRACPDCGAVVRSAPTEQPRHEYDWRAPRRITQHFIKGKRCPGSGKVVRLVQEYHGHRLGRTIRQEVLA